MTTALHRSEFAVLRYPGYVALRLALRYGRINQANRRDENLPNLKWYCILSFDTSLSLHTYFYPILYSRSGIDFTVALVPSPPSKCFSRFVAPHHQTQIN